MNLPTRRRSTSVELGDGSVAEVFVTRSVVAWLDGSREVQWLVTDDWAGGPDEPVGLIGTALLTPSFLMIDFQARTVEIERQY